MQSLHQFLKKRIPNDKKIYTHTRIGNRNLHVPGGVYNIPVEDKALFYKLYHHKVFVNQEYEYLTEAQHKSGGPILVDLDLRYSTEVEERCHTESHILDIINIYLTKIAEIVHVTEKTTFPIFVLEKPHINTLPHITKDGIHLVIGIHMDRTLQLMLRERVLESIQEVVGGLKLENNIDNVVDISVTRGGLWQMFGSRKPGQEAYELVYYYNAEWEGGLWSPLNVVNITNIDKLDLSLKISARKSTHIVYKVHENIREEYEKRKLQQNNKIIRKAKISSTTNFYKIIDYSKIKNEGDLQELQIAFLEAMSAQDYNIRETHAFTMILAPKYYDNYDKWIRVGFALHNTDPRMFLTWLTFSAQSQKFDFREIPNHWEMWQGMREEGVTERSIHYWARECDEKAYIEIQKQTIDYFIEKSLERKTDHSLALVLYHMFKGQFTCASIKHKTWYEFYNHKWSEVDSGTTLREKISKALLGEYNNKTARVKDSVQETPNNDPVWTGCVQSKLSNLLSLSQKMGNVDGKNKIMREAQELFYDKDFLEKLDTNPYLLHFKNGIYDFEEKRFRSGKSDDYVSLSTKREYIVYKKKNQEHVQYKQEIEEFFSQLFINQELRRYMWEHLASTLIGTNENETFNIYNGVGRNGKSKIVDLMSKVLGQLKGVVPITLVTRKRGDCGKASPEIAQLRGVRYAVMQEPSKNDKINEGQMKELTGGDTIQARALFKDPIEFKPQFKLVVCTNNLFDIESNDDGTWRRIRVCEFLSKFCGNPSTNKKDREFKGIAPTILLKKFDKWAPIFTHMLIEICNKKRGVVKDCEMVLRASNKYRGSQDYLGKFFIETITTHDTNTLTISNTYEAFKDWYGNMGYGRNTPRRCELQTLLEKKLGIYPKTGWRGYTIRHPTEI